MGPVEVVTHLNAFPATGRSEGTACRSKIAHRCHLILALWRLTLLLDFMSTQVYSKQLQQIVSSLWSQLTSPALMVEARDFFDFFTYDEIRRLEICMYMSGI